MSIPASTSNRTAFLALPTFEWGEPNEWWSALAILPTRRKHDSGWAHIAVVGIRYGEKGDEAHKILAFPDDIDIAGYWRNENNETHVRRMDSYYPSGIMRIWCAGHELRIDGPGSSVTISARKKATA